ncbi:MAG: tRNA (adenosine(37)-N6)-threonylcarbamoyltransferase complex ATPase subunit type 1 TsaE [Clostridiales bacterium]|nr:tRNA (adenosine(37)-N6)-threonylcarbamoyltransferase complex ATPase subunit type 1 TsaE [Clostridiales bacterium]
MQKIISHNEYETIKIGERIASKLKKSDIVCLEGDLGAGKTTLSKAIAYALGVKEHVTSPTFTIVHEYEAVIPLYHFDVYRIDDMDEMFEIGFEEYIYGEGICLIEWADKIKELIPENSIWISISYGNNIDEREIQINGLPEIDFIQSERK